LKGDRAEIIVKRDSYENLVINDMVPSCLRKNNLNIAATSSIGNITALDVAEFFNRRRAALFAITMHELATDTRHTCSCYNGKRSGTAYIKSDQTH
jgi:hypothetical protein